MSIELDEEIRGIINGALVGGTPMVLASADAEGRPRMTFRGSIQAFSDDQLGFWARNAEGSTMDNIAVNPHVAMILRDPKTRVVLNMTGRAKLVTGADRDRVYDLAPEFEQKADPEKKGSGVVVDLDRIEGFLGLGPNGERRMVRQTRD